VEAAIARRDQLGLNTPVFVGSGVTPETVAEYLGIADGVIVGSALKTAGRPSNPVTSRVVSSSCRSTLPPYARTARMVALVSALTSGFSTVAPSA
jgi:predicted TIM-barrel enzyme